MHSNGFLSVKYITEACAWKGTNTHLECPRWYFTPTMTNYGQCFTFNADPQNASEFKQTLDGGGYGLTHSVYVLREEYTGQLTPHKTPLIKQGIGNQ